MQVQITDLAGSGAAINIGPIEVQVIKKDEGVSIYIFGEDGLMQELWYLYSEAKSIDED